MLKYFLVFISLIILSTEKINAQKKITNLKFQTLEGKVFDLNGIGNRKATVLVFLFPDCPACQGYSLTLNNLSREFEKDNIEFYGIFPGTYYSIEEMNKFRSEYKIRFQLLTDTGSVSVKFLKAQVVPEAFIIGADLNILYRGRIDDWLVSIGKKKVKISKHDLEDALTAIRSGKPVPVRETTPVGCIIE